VEHEQTPDIQPDVQDAARRTSYGDVPYVSQPFPQTHPDRLATLGRLFGLTPAPIPRCRVLELGCASGGNLIPLAYQLPESEFVGVNPSKGLGIGSGLVWPHW
jgi:hypothetical protein